jgi:putative hemolysin
MRYDREFLKPLVPLQNWPDGSLRKRTAALANTLIENALFISHIKAVYNAIPPSADPFEFLERALEGLGLTYPDKERDRQTVPGSGPVIVVSNHPFGAIDGMVLASFLASIRKDIKILANYFLSAIPELRPLFLPVDPFGSRGSVFKNRASVTKALRWIQEGGMLIVFPAGEVSHFSPKTRKVEDPIWSNTAARLVHLSHAPVLPAYFQGRNSLLFQTAGLVHPLLRTAMLPRELLKKRNTTVRFRIGDLIPYKTLSRIQKPSDLTNYLRFRTDLLGLGSEKKKKVIRLPKRRKVKGEALIPPPNPWALEREVQSLPNTQRLIENQDFAVYCARAHQIPKVLREIGRLREETFRAVGEGTGKSFDLDRFDNIYRHLFVWNTDEKEVVGAYRLGPTDEILPKHGKKGIYTYTLFKYRDPLLREMGPALEMGRTFVRIEYQKSYSPLLLLWKGIGHYVAEHPHYKTLFGAVSISNEYQSYSRQLIATFLKLNSFSTDLAKMVKPRRPFRGRDFKGSIQEKTKQWANDLDEISSWISAMEEDGKGVPILLKQYLKLGGKILAFNVDPAFGNALDGLILVDLTLTDPKVLKRYMGAEGFARFRRHQKASEETRANGPRSALGS